MSTLVKITEACKRIEAKGFEVENSFEAKGRCENVPCGRSSSITVENWSGAIEFSKEDDGIFVFGRVEWRLVRQTFNKRNPYDRMRSPGESVVFTADAETKKLLGWK